MAIKLYQQCRRNTGKRKYNVPCIMSLCRHSVDMNLSWSVFHAHHEKGTMQWIKRCYFIIASFVWRASCITSHVPSFKGSPVLKPWTNSGHGMWSVILLDTTKQIHWISPNSYGEDLYVIMLGGLHIEIAAWKALGKWLDSSSCSIWHSNWKAWFPFKASHVSRTRHEHQVTAAALYTLLQKAYSLCWRT